jgi:hypothetical protein
MKRTPCSTIAAVLICVAALHATPAAAQRVFVAAQGSDANPCTFALPCRTFQHAHDVVAAGGEIDVLDPAGYGALHISKAISIQGHGFSGISVASGLTGILVTAGATDAVSLNGLLIEGSGVGGIGIDFRSGRSLVVESCVVRNLTVNGLQLAPSVATPLWLAVSASYFNENGQSGIAIGSGSGGVTAAIARSIFNGNGFAGLFVNGTNGSGPVSVAATDSDASNNIGGSTGTGFLAQSSAGHSVVSLVLTRATVVGNLAGVVAMGANATLRLAQSTVTGNQLGYGVFSSASIMSYGDNYIAANGGSSGALGGATRQ